MFACLFALVTWVGLLGIQVSIRCSLLFCCLLHKLGLSRAAWVCTWQHPTSSALAPGGEIGTHTAGACSTLMYLLISLQVLGPFYAHCGVRVLLALVQVGWLGLHYGCPTGEPETLDRAPTHY